MAKEHKGKKKENESSKRVRQKKGGVTKGSREGGQVSKGGSKERNGRMCQKCGMDGVTKAAAAFVCYEK